MKLTFSKEIENLVPYKPGQSDKDVREKYKRDFFVKLASNENPYPPSPQVLKSIQAAARQAYLYPDPSCRDLVEEASKYYSVSSDQILVGNGSNELIDLLIRLMCEPGDQILTSEAAFIAYKICATAARVRTTEIPLKEGHQIDLQSFSESLKKMDRLPRLVFIPNPNNPTGTYIPKQEVDEFLKEWGNQDEMLIVFDEAYNEFVEAEDFSKTQDLLAWDNVLILKTLSKVFGLAALRVGFLIGPQKILSYVHRIRNPFNVNALAQAAAIEALKDQEGLTQTVAKIKEERKGFSLFLKDLGIDFCPSQANFIFFDCGGEALDYHERFLSEGLILRPLLPYGFKNHMRISIGDKEQMNYAKEVFTKIYKEAP